MTWEYLGNSGRVWDMTESGNPPNVSWDCVPLELAEVGVSSNGVVQKVVLDLDVTKERLECG